MEKALFAGNRLCDLLGIRIPLLQGGMVWCSGWRLAAAVSSGGGLGVLGAGSMHADYLRESIKKVRAATSSPFGVNVPLLYKHAEACIAVCEEERVPVVVTSAGSPSKWTTRLHTAGCKVGHVVANEKFTRKAEAAGVDFLIAEGFEAGGHNGVEELTTLVLAQMARRWTSLPLVSAGGYFDGVGLAAALVLGADGVQMGTRFACTRESSASEATKEYLLALGDSSTQLVAKAVSPTRMVRNAYCEGIVKLEREGASREVLEEFMGKGRTRKGLLDGDLIAGEVEAGQIVAAIDDLPSAVDVVREVGAACVARLQEIAKGGVQCG